MKTLQILCALSFPLAMGTAFAQSTGDSVRGTTPPGMSQSGSSPSEGAITGGQPIVPGESAGVPNKDIGNGTTRERIERCYDLTGSLREECLRKERSAGGGATVPSEGEKMRVPQTIETPK